MVDPRELQVSYTKFRSAAMAKSRPTKKILDSYTIKGTDKVVKVGDCVVMRAEDAQKPPYIARVEKIEADGRGNHVRVRVRWYYRPEESIGDRRQFHGAKELFLSDHFDEQSADTIEGKCSVHTFKNYTKLDSVGTEDYFCRFEYNAATGGFTPDRVAVHCKCEMPYNPDVLMAQCEACKDWFHPPCVNLTTEQVKKMDHFFCSDCIKEDDMKLRNSGKDSPPPEQKEGGKTEGGHSKGKDKDELTVVPLTGDHNQYRSKRINPGKGAGYQHGTEKERSNAGSTNLRIPQDLRS